MDNVVYRVVSTIDLIEQLREHLFNNVVMLDGKLYQQKMVSKNPLDGKAFLFIAY